MPRSTTNQGRENQTRCFCFLSIDATYLLDVVKELEAGELLRKLPPFSIPVPGSPWTQSENLAVFWEELSAAKAWILNLKRLQTRARREQFSGKYGAQCLPLNRLLLLLQVGLRLEQQWRLIGGALAAVGKISAGSQATDLIERDWRMDEQSAQNELPRCFAKVLPTSLTHLRDARAVVRSWQKFRSENHI